MYSAVFQTWLTTELPRINIDLHNKKMLITKLCTSSMTHDSWIRFGFDMLLFNIKQVNLEYILRCTKQNLKHATPIQIKKNNN